MTPLNKHTIMRLPKIQQGLREGHTIKQISEDCGVSDKTIDRDLKTWLQSGEFDNWLREEFLRLHNLVQGEDPIEAYRQITTLLKSTLTRRLETRQNVTISEPGLEFEFDPAIREALLKAKAEQKQEKGESETHG